MPDDVQFTAPQGFLRVGMYVCACVKFIDNKLRRKKEKTWILWGTIPSEAPLLGMRIRSRHNVQY